MAIKKFNQYNKSTLDYKIKNIKYWENFSVKQLYLEYKILFAKEIKNKIKKNLENNSEFFSKINLIV